MTKDEALQDSVEVSEDDGLSTQVIDVMPEPITDPDTPGDVVVERRPDAPPIGITPEGMMAGNEAEILAHIDEWGAVENPSYTWGLALLRLSNRISQLEGAPEGEKKAENS